MRRTPGRILTLLAIALCACGNDNKSAGQPDGGDPDGGKAAACGNLAIEAGEDCDDGNLVLDSVCDNLCHFTCGNGVVDTTVAETCDTSIPSGIGACPTACNDNDACTADVLSGSECTATCLSSVITTATDGDGCCPAGANANTDSDCTAMCGNGVLESGELCDMGIVAGAGACPTTCNDGQSCTTDALVGASSCQAHCTVTPITTPINNDGCCPTGATSGTDNDCSPACGNGFVDTGETCDKAIATGAGKCPTTCTDGVACTRDVLLNPGTCTAACSFPAITMAMNGDGCCPTGANANTDNDCTPFCGNGVKEGTEQCDDGNMVNTDACTNNCMNGVVVTAYRFNTLALRDPHAYASVIGCNDITDSFFGNAVNQQLANNLTQDNDMPPDGFLDLSPTLVFRPLNQGGVLTSPLEIHFANCTTPVGSTSCKPGAAAPILLTATNQAAGTCLTTIAGTTHPYTPAITSSTSPCFVSTQSTVTVALGGVNIVLHDARIAATYVGTPATQVVNGLLRGFVTEADADATIFPSNLAVVGGHTLSYILPGGAGNCRPANQSDKDVNNGVSGWWFYLNFTAPKTPWSDN
ncbi:MAG: DUF4215 domain-containing protein [Myxococcales bacterium]|nr:DUF4215 domain-containing protein [Myxococcales bacterium]